MKGRAIINRSVISVTSPKKVCFSPGFLLPSNVCLEERCMIATAHLQGLPCVLPLKGRLISVVFLVSLFTIELKCVLFENFERAG